MYVCMCEGECDMMKECACMWREIWRWMNVCVCESKGNNEWMCVCERNVCKGNIYYIYM